MIGDWVLYTEFGKNEFHRVEIVEPTRVWLNGCKTYVPDEFIKPIPLTPEILKKNCFVANKHVYPYPYYEYINKEHKLKIGFAFPQGNRTSYKEQWVYIDSEHVFIEHLPCVFVHEIQHAFRSCRISKDIVL